MNTTSPWRIERLTPGLRDAYLAFFDHERGPAFADNPEWAKCYCHYYEVPVALTWSAFDGAAAIVCFVIPPVLRRRGIAKALLAHGVADLAARCFALVDAFPWNSAPDADAPTDHYHGTMSMFENAGFATLDRQDDLTNVRKSLR